MLMIGLHWFPVMVKLGTGSLVFKLVTFFYHCHSPILCISCFCSIFRQTSRFGTLHSRL